jgi:hypothetical protein
MMPVPAKPIKFDHKDDEAFLASRKPDGVEDADLQDHEAFPGGDPDDTENAEADPE